MRLLVSVLIYKLCNFGDSAYELSALVFSFKIGILQYQDKWESESTVSDGYQNLVTLIEESNKLNTRLQKELNNMIDNFKYQTREAILFQNVIIPQGCWLNNKTIGEVYFWNYTEATIVAIKAGKDGTLQVSPGPDFPLRDGDTLIIVGKDKYSFDRVLNFITYGVEDE